MGLDGEVRLSASNRGAVAGIKEVENALERAARKAQDAGRKADKSGAGWEGLSRKLAGAGGPASGLTSTLGALGPAASRAALGIAAVTAATAAATAVAVKGVSQWAAYQDQIANVSTMLDRKALGGEQYNKLVNQYSEGVRSLSVEMNQHTAVLAQGLYDILSASVDASRGLEVLEAAGRAAIGGNTDVATSADLVTGAMNAWGGAFASATEVTDIAFATVKAGKLTYAELAQSLGQVAPSANMVGMQFSQVGAIMALLTQNNIKANEAASATNQFLLSFVRQSPKAIKTWHELSRGTELANTEWSAALVRGANLEKTLRVLARATDAQKVALFSEVNALKAGNVLISQQDSYRAKLRATTHAAGETEEAFAKKTGTLHQQLGRLDKIAGDVWKTIGQGLAPEVKQITDGIVSWYQANGQLLKTDILLWIEKLKSGLGSLKRLVAAPFTGVELGTSLDERIKQKQAQIMAAEESLKWERVRLKGYQQSTGFEFLDKLAKPFGRAGSADASAEIASLQNQLGLLDKQLNILESKKFAPSAQEVKARRQMYKDLADPFQLDPKYQELYKALDKARAGYQPPPPALSDSEKKRAAENQAIKKATQERMAQMAGLADMEQELRAQSLTGLDQSLYKMEQRYEGYYTKLDDWVLSDYGNLKNYEARKAKITQAKAAERAKIVAQFRKKQQEAENKTSLAHQQYALAMAKATGNSLAEQGILHDQFIREWEKRGISREQAHALWLAQHEKRETGMLDRLTREWGDTNGNIERSTENMVKSVQGMLTDTFSGVLTGEINDLDDAVQVAADNIVNIMANLASQLATIGITTGLSWLFGGGDTPTITINGAGGGGGAPAGAAASTGASIIGGQLVKPALASGLGSLGFETAADIVAGKTSLWAALFGKAGTEAISQAAVQAASQAGAEAAAQYGVSAAGEFAGSQAATGAAQAADAAMFGQTGMEGAASGAWATAAGIGGVLALYEGGLGIANLLGAQGSAPHLWEIPGTIWEGISGQAESMTPDQAKANWFGGGGSDNAGQGQMAFIENMTAKMKELNQTFESPGLKGSGFELFGQAAKDAAGDLERLKTVAGFSQKQIDALVDSMDPLAQQFLESGQAAQEIDAQIQQLTTDLQASQHDGFAPGADRAHEFAQGLAEVAASAGLSDRALEQVSASLDTLEGQAARGEITIAGMAGAFRDDLVGALGETAAGFDSAAQAAGRFLGKARSASRLPDFDPMTGPAAPSTGNADLGYYHSGGRVSGLPRFHQGGQLDDLPRFHHGYRITGLGHDEVPIIGKLGEFMVRSERVTARTLPALQAFNLGAQAAPPPGPAMIFNAPLLEIHGPVIGSEDNLEDFARRLETKLRELQNSRWGA